MSGHARDRPATNPLRTSVRHDKGNMLSHDNNYSLRDSQHFDQRHSQNYHAAPPSHDRGRPQRKRSLTKGERLRRGPDSRGPPRHRKISAVTAHFVAATGEFVGTVLFLWFAFAWHLTVANRAQGTGPNGVPTDTTVLYISLGYGFSLLVVAFAFYRISGGLFNPAVALAMIITGTLPPVRGLILIPAELLGGIVAAALVKVMFPPGNIIAVETLLNPGVSIAQGVFIEMFLTSLLVFTIHMLAAEKSKVTFMAPLGIGLSLFVAELAGVGYTGGSLNPARSLGPAVAASSFPGYFWIYVVGPFLGSLVAGGYYKFVTWLNYQEANPQQDSAGGDFEGDKSNNV